MKLEKREITLNECDSLQDVVCFEKGLLGEYVETLLKMERKETKNQVAEYMKEVGAELCLTVELWRKAVEGQEKK